MAVVIALCFGRSRDPYKDLPFNQFVRFRANSLEDEGHRVFSDMDEIKSAITTIDLAVGYAKAAGKNKFILLVANNWYDHRIGHDLVKACQNHGIKDPVLDFDLEVASYHNDALYNQSSTEPWTRSRKEWAKYNFKYYMLSFFFHEEYRNLFSQDLGTLKPSHNL